MNLPIDPTENDLSPQELIQELPSKAARRRVLQAADLSIDVDDQSFTEMLEELSQIELRRAASQLRFAGARTTYYYRIEKLQQVSPDGAIGRVGDVGSPGAYGPEVQKAIRDHDRIYVVCNVPETGSQTQLTLSKENRPTTVATFKPGTQLLAVRASDNDTAGATAEAVSSYLGLEGASKVSFLANRVRERFEEACVDGYSTLQLRHTAASANTKEIEVRSKEPEDRNVSDVRFDSIVDDLLHRGDTELEIARGIISIPTAVSSIEYGEQLHPRVSIRFPDGSVTFEQFVPEQILIELDDIVRESI